MKTQQTLAHRDESGGMDPSPVAFAEPLSRCRITLAGRLDRGLAALDLSAQNRGTTNGDAGRFQSAQPTLKATDVTQFPIPEIDV
jgi:hypothetical protein